MTIVSPAIATVESTCESLSSELLHEFLYKSRADRPQPRFTHFRPNAPPHKMEWSVSYQSTLPLIGRLLETA